MRIRRTRQLEQEATVMGLMRSPLKSDALLWATITLSWLM